MGRIKDILWFWPTFRHNDNRITLAPSPFYYRNRGRYYTFTLWVRDQAKLYMYKTDTAKHCFCECCVTLYLWHHGTHIIMFSFLFYNGFGRLVFKVKAVTLPSLMNNMNKWKVDRWLSNSIFYFFKIIRNCDFNCKYKGMNQ